MNPAQSDQESATLQRYLRTLHDQRVLIVVAVVLGAVIALGWSLTRSNTYEAKVQLRFNDESTDVTILGISNAPPVGAAQDIAADAHVVTGNTVVDGVSRALKGALTPGQLRDDLSTDVDPTSNLVTVKLRAHGAALATTAANQVAAQVIGVQTALERQRLTSTAAALARRNSRLGNSADDRIRRRSYSDQIARLTALSAYVRPVEMIQSASRPTSPVSPKPVRNTILGAFLGLVLGLLAAFGREALDRRLRRPEDVSERLGLRVVGQLGEAALGTVAGLGLDGSPASAEALEPFRMLRANLEAIGGGRPRVVLVTGAVGEEGTTTVATGLALALALAGRSTVLVEANLRGSALAERLGLAPRPGLSDCLLDRAGVAEAVQPVEARVDGTGDAVPLHLLPAGSDTGRPAELLSSERFGELLDDLGEAYDAIVLDSAPLLPVVDTRDLVGRADAGVVCLRAHRATRGEAAALRATLDLLPATPLGVALTGVRPRDDIGYRRSGSGSGRRPEATPAPEAARV